MMISRRTVYVVLLLVSLVTLACCHGDEDPDMIRTTDSDTLKTDYTEMDAGSEPRDIDITMPGVTPDMDDQYWCTTMKAPEKDAYITDFQALSENSRAHHILLFGCKTPGSSEQTWKCGGRACAHGESIMFAWAKHANPTHLPEDVGFHIGGETVEYIVLQVHYKNSLLPDESDHSGIRMTVTDVSPSNIAGIMLIVSGGEPIPPHKEKFSLDISCQYKGKQPLFPFAFRVHAHSLATVITGYQYNDSWHQLGKGNPQWPQAFYPMDEKFQINPNDQILGRCTYNTMNKATDTQIGALHTDEMCNFYMMYYTDGAQGWSYYDCYGHNNRELEAAFPPGSDVPPPRNRLLEDIASGNAQGIEEDPDWPEDASFLGQISGVSTDKAGNVHVFHRGSRTWTPGSFDVHNKFLLSQPIAEDVIVTFNKDGKVMDHWGANMFYMPHGLHIDRHGNTWVTDVALHQVMRFKAKEHTPDLILGERFVPGSDPFHFCKPAGIATLSSGQFYVSDGYCNARVMKFTADGKMLKQWGEPSSSIEGNGYPPPATFALPHGIALLESANLVCVADRLNRRIQCFDLDGNFVRQMFPSDKGTQVFSVAFSPANGLLYAVSGQDLTNQESLQGYVFNPLNGSLLQTWQPDTVPLSHPHDIALSKDGSCLFVSEIKPNKLHRFHIDDPEASGSVLSAAVDPQQRMGGHPSSSDEDGGGEDVIDKDAEDDFGASLIIGALLIVPVIIIVVITVCLRLKKRENEAHKYTKLLQEEELSM